MPLVFAPLNKQLKIIQMKLDENIKSHLIDIGISINANIVILSSLNGNLICLVKDSRIAINKDIATKIFVV